MSTFTWKPAPGAKQTVKPRILTAQYGDGYEQRVQDGLNTMPRTWSVSFSGSVSYIDAIDTFLKALNGAMAFSWTPPRGAAGRFVCDAQWDRVTVDRATDTLSATFREVFEP